MRHAKTESPYSLKRDFLRVLTEKGASDARQMGIWLQAKGIGIDKVVSSPAIRTLQTTEGVCESMGIDASIVEFREALYHATPETFTTVIESFPQEANTVLLVSHNDGITHFATQLTNARIDYMQPGSVFAVSCACIKWGEFFQRERTFLFYRQPE